LRSNLRKRAWRIWDALFTGVPYGIFKMGTGWYWWTWAHASIGGPLMLAWGLIDVGLNLAAAIWARPIPFCLLSQLGTAIDRRRGHPEIRFNDLGLALDTLLSFSLVSGMIWNGCIPKLVPVFGRAWDLAVVCNVLAVGVARVVDAVDRPVSQS